MNLAPYWKTVVASLIAVAIVAVQAIQEARHDGSWTTEDTLVVALAVLGAVGVYFKSNAPDAG